MNKREMIANGAFYPNKKEEIISFIKNNLLKVSPMEIKAAIAPHAGYIYSGKVAVKTIEQINPKKEVFLLGPNHTGLGEDLSVYPEGAWKSVLSDVEIDKGIVEKLTEKSMFKKDVLAHLREHSLEVELPILSYFFKEFKIVPIACSLSDLKALKEAGKFMASVIRNNHLIDDYLIVTSSDMTHYQPVTVAKEKDNYALEAILNLDEDLLYKRVIEEDISMCGVLPTVVMLSCIKQLGVNRAKLVDYRSSGEVSGDFSEVVGYAGVVFS